MQQTVALSDQEVVLPPRRIVVNHWLDLLCDLLPNSNRYVLEPLALSVLGNFYAYFDRKDATPTWDLYPFVQSSDSLYGLAVSDIGVVLTALRTAFQKALSAEQSDFVSIVTFMLESWIRRAVSRYEETMLRQVRDRQADMVQRMAMLNALNHCSARLNESLDQGETLNATAWLARQLTDADLTTVYLIEEGELRLKATSSSHEIPANRPPNATIDFEIQCGAHDVMAVDLLNTVIFDVNHQDVPIQVPRLALGYDAIEAVLCVPLRAGDVSLGKLTAVYFTPQQFPAYQVKMLQIFASHAGRAIQNAKLFEQIEAMTLSQERQRIACEMHDTMLQTLVTMNINLRVAIQQAHQAHWQEALPIFEEARRLGKVAVQEGRDTLNSLREDCYCNVQEADIRSIVQTEAGLFAQQAGIMPQIDVPAGIALPYRVVYQLQRLVGEALTNILRHADATHTSIQASVQDGVLCLRVVDNGKGFQPLRTTRPGSFGLLSMQERARLIDAEVMIDSLPGRGTTVEIRRPHPYPA